MNANIALARGLHILSCFWILALAFTVCADALAGLTESGTGDASRVWLLERGQVYAQGRFPSRLAEMPGHVRFTMAPKAQPISASALARSRSASAPPRAPRSTRAARPPRRRG